jgi:transposase
MSSNDSADAKKNEIKPWLKKEWCIPAKGNAEFICKMEDVLDVYKRPYDENYPVVCMDETNKQQLKEKRSPLAMKPGKVQRYDTQYERNGTSNIFLSFEPLTGKRNLKVTKQRTRTDWAYFIKELVEENYPHAKKILLVMDNLNTHTGSSLYETFEPAQAKRILDKLEIHYTPKHGSWLNIAEIELSHLSRQCLNRRIPDRATLTKEATAWCKQRNEKKVKVDWQFTTEDARIKLKKLYPLLVDKGQN